MHQIVPKVLLFDRFALDLTRGRVCLGEEQIDLPPKPFEVLRYLAENAGRLVPKRELFEAVWPNISVTDDSLVQCIGQLREKLGDVDHRLIKTVPRRGYLLDVPVTRSESGPLATGPSANVKRLPAPVGDHRPAEIIPPATDSDLDPRGVLGKRSRALVAAISLVALLLGSAWVLRSWLSAENPAPLTMMAVPSIAVLPVKILGRDADNEVAALADDITRELWGTLRGFKLDIRRASPSNDVLASWKSLGKDLNARYVLWSGARREGDLIHINVNLIEAESAREVWAGSFDYRPSDSGAMQRTATRISRMLSTELLQVEVRRPLPAKPEAAHFTMLGRSLMNNERSAKTNGEAIALFEKALAIDPEDFLALVNYARATADHILNLWAPPEERAERVVKAEAAVKLALRLDSSYAGAHTAHGGVLRVRGDHAQAIVAFKQALMLNPNYANAQAELGRELIELGLADETVAYVEKAIAISPTDFELYKWCYWAGLASLHVGDHVAALDWARRSYQANRAYDNTVRLMAIAYAYAGEESEARAKMSEFLTLRPRFALANWQQANASPHSLVTEQRARMYEAMKRLGAPEGKVKATARP
jgi:DNA-binding winged helix-turn-helix (wHTH) protein/tetratricopeptide (TPR) repeat protein